MYSRGDQIIHPRYGAGTIVGKKKMTFKGKTRAYHIVELVGERGEVMIPVEFATDMNIRPAIADLSILEEMFALPPTELSDDYRSRQASIQKQIQTREPEAMATALRDLFWRERNDKLTSVEMKMKSSLMKMLSHEIAVMWPEMTVEKANSHLTQMLYHMVEEKDAADALLAEEAAAQLAEEAAAQLAEEAAAQLVEEAAAQLAEEADSTACRRGRRSACRRGSSAACRRGRRSACRRGRRSACRRGRRADCRRHRIRRRGAA